VAYLIIKSNFTILFLSTKSLLYLKFKYVALPPSSSLSPSETLTLRQTTACLHHHIMNQQIHRFETPQLAALPHVEIQPSTCDEFLSSVIFIKFIRPKIIRFPSMLPLISRLRYYSLKFESLYSDSFSCFIFQIIFKISI